MPISTQRARQIFQEIDPNFLVSAGRISKRYLSIVAGTRFNPRDLILAIQVLHGVKVHDESIVVKFLTIFSSRAILNTGGYLQRLGNKSSPFDTVDALLKLRDTSETLLTTDNIDKVFLNPSFRNVEVILTKYKFIKQAVDKDEAKKLVAKLEKFGPEFMDARILRDISLLKKPKNIFIFIEKISRKLTKLQIKSILTSSTILAIANLRSNNSRQSIDSLCLVLTILKVRVPSLLNQRNISQVILADDMYKSLVMILLNSLMITPYASIVDEIVADIQSLNLLAKSSFLSLSSESSVKSPRLLALDLALIHRSRSLSVIGGQQPTDLGSVVTNTITGLIRAQLNEIIADPLLSSEYKLKYFYSLQILGFNNYRQALSGEEDFSNLSRQEQVMTVADALKFRSQFIAKFKIPEVKRDIRTALRTESIMYPEDSVIDAHILKNLLDLKGLNIQLNREQMRQLMPQSLLIPTEDLPDVEGDIDDGHASVGTIDTHVAYRPTPTPTPTPTTPVMQMPTLLPTTVITPVITLAPETIIPYARVATPLPSEPVILTDIQSPSRDISRLIQVMPAQDSLDDNQDDRDPFLIQVGVPVMSRS